MPDKKGEFYKKYFFHFIWSGEKAYKFKCPKTESVENYCPWCHASRILYQGSADDKKTAKKFYRQTKFASNVYIIDDPRDSQEEESRKVSGSVRIYEFPGTIEGKIKTQITDEEEGRGAAIFDPEEGYNFLVKVASKKPDSNGTIWPTYEASEFSLNKNAILEDSDKIEKVMESVYDLSEFINSLEMDTEFHKKLLKQEMLYEDVQDQFEKYMEGKESEGKDSALDQMDDVFDGKQEMPKENEGESKKESNGSTNSDDVSDEQLLDELQDL